MLWLKDGDYRGVSAVEDYLYRPEKCEQMSLYEWVCRAQKEKIPKALANSLQKDDEYLVDDVITHKWVGSHVQFLVKWTAGDQTWESYTTCSHLQVLDFYLSAKGVSSWKDLPKYCPPVTTCMTDSKSGVEEEEEDDTDDTDNVDNIDTAQQTGTASPLDKPVHLFFMNEHPQSKTHRIFIRNKKDQKIPDFKGRPLPRKDKGNREEYCMTMLTLFCPWRNGLDLKDKESSWDTTFADYTFTKRQLELMKCFNLRYECLDARDDFAAKLKEGLIDENDLPAGFTSADLIDLDDNTYYGNEAFEEFSDEQLEELAREYSELSPLMMARIRKMHEAQQLLASCGAMKELSSKPTTVLPESGGAESNEAWSEKLQSIKNQIIEERKAQAAKKQPTDLPNALPVNHHVDVVKVIDQSYMSASFRASNPEDQKQIDETSVAYKLNKDQERAFRIIANHAVSGTKEQLKMYLGGMAGTGKSQVIKALTHFFHIREEDYRMICVAPTGAAAALINGSTYHSILGINQYTTTGSMSSITVTHDLLKHVDYMFLDEVSMLDCNSLYDISKRMGEAMGIGENIQKKDIPFGGINVILAGDFAQLAPPGRGSSLYSGDIESVVHTTNAYVKQEAAVGKALWHQFTTVVILRENMRQRSQTSNDAKFRTCLENLRYKSCTSDDIALLRSRIANEQPGHPSLNDPNFHNVSIITKWNTYRDKINELLSQRFARETQQNLVSFYSIDRWTSKNTDDNKRRLKRRNVLDPIRESDRIAKPVQEVLWSIQHNDTDHHPSVLRVCLGLPIMIKKNIATECGVTNGAEGTVVGWTSRPIDKDHNALDTLFVKLTSCPKPIQIEGLPENVVPISHLAMSISVTLPNGDDRPVNRDQVPVVPNFAMTDFCSQGRTRPYNVVDLQNCTSVQSAYTALSRGSTYEGTLLVQGFDQGKLTGGISGYLRQEFRELELLDEITALQWNKQLPKKIVGVTRGHVIFLYRRFKGDMYVPNKMATSLRWSRLDPYLNDKPVKETAYMIIERPKKKKLGKAKIIAQGKESKNMTLVKAHGTQTLKVLSTDPRTQHKSKKRKLDPDTEKEYNMSNKLMSHVQSSLPHNAGPAGISWDANNYSCAYDALFTILNNWLTDLAGFSDRLSHTSNDQLITLSQAFTQASENDTPLEKARDLVRQQLHLLDPNMFSLEGHEMTDITDLCSAMFKEQSKYARWTTKCAQCDQDARSHPVNNMLWHCTRTIWLRSVYGNGTCNAATTSKWIKAIRTYRADTECVGCHRVTMIKELEFDRMPNFIVVSVGDNLNLRWEHKISVEESDYQLCGLVYWGSHHFTCRVITNDGNVWYHDGIRTGQVCEFQGNIQTMSYTQLAKAANSRKCILGIYSRI